MTDPIYEIADEELRQRAFAPVYRDFFTKLGLDKLIADLMAERPFIGESIDRCVVREAARTKAESAELLVRTVVAGEGTPETHVGDSNLPKVVSRFQAICSSHAS